MELRSRKLSIVPSVNMNPRRKKSSSFCDKQRFSSVELKITHLQKHYESKSNKDTSDFFKVLINIFKNLTHEKWTISNDSQRKLSETCITGYRNNFKPLVIIKCRPLSSNLDPKTKPQGKLMLQNNVGNLPFIKPYDGMSLRSRILSTDKADIKRNFRNKKKENLEKFNIKRLEIKIEKLNEKLIENILVNNKNTSSTSAKENNFISLMKILANSEANGSFELNNDAVNKLKLQKSSLTTCQSSNNDSSYHFGYKNIAMSNENNEEIPTLASENSTMDMNDIKFPAQIEKTECPQSSQKVNFNEKESLHKLPNTYIRLIRDPGIENLLKSEKVLLDNSLTLSEIENSENKSNSRYHCSSCEKSFSRKDSFNLHLAIHCRKKFIKCNYCSKKYTFRSMLKRHEQFHHGCRRFLCFTCKKRFRIKEALMKHQLFHLDKNPYCCLDCDKTFSHAVNLKLHKRIHRIIRPYWCTVCNQNFTRESILVNHIKDHEANEIIYQCHGCKALYNQINYSVHKCKGLLKRNRKRFRKNNQCNFCRKYFRNFRALKMHSCIIVENLESMQALRTENSLYTKFFRKTIFVRSKNKDQMEPKTSTADSYKLKNIYLDNSCIEKQTFDPGTINKNKNRPEVEVLNFTRKVEGNVSCVCRYCDKKFQNNEDLILHLEKIHLIIRKSDQKKILSDKETAGRTEFRKAKCREESELVNSDLSKDSELNSEENRDVCNDRKEKNIFENHDLRGKIPNQVNSHNCNANESKIFHLTTNNNTISAGNANQSLGVYFYPALFFCRFCQNQGFLTLEDLESHFKICKNLKISAEINVENSLRLANSDNNYTHDFALPIRNNKIVENSPKEQISQFLITADPSKSLLNSSNPLISELQSCINPIFQLENKRESDSNNSQKNTEKIDINLKQISREVSIETVIKSNSSEYLNNSELYNVTLNFDSTLKDKATDAYICKYCDKLFHNVSDFISHFKNFHIIQNPNGKNRIEEENKMVDNSSKSNENNKNSDLSNCYNIVNHHEINIKNITTQIVKDNSYCGENATFSKTLSVKNNEVKDVEIAYESKTSSFEKLNTRKRRKKYFVTKRLECETRIHENYMTECGSVESRKNKDVGPVLNQHSEEKNDTSSVLASDANSNSNRIRKNKKYKRKGGFCSVCSEYFSTYTKLRRHKMKHQSLIHSCEICGIKYFTFRRLKIHQKNCKIKSKEDCYQLCHVCGKSVVSLRNHMLYHQEVKRFKCNGCSMEFTEKASLKKHTSRVHAGETVFKCSECPSYFNKLTRLGLHKQKEHGNLLPYECNLCGRQFTQGSSLGIHILCHKGEKPFKCNDCPRTFRTEYILQIHRKSVHTNERIYKCDHCNKTFVTKYNMKVHIQSHLKVKKTAQLNKTKNEKKNSNKKIGKKIPV